PATPPACLNPTVVAPRNAGLPSFDTSPPPCQTNPPFCATRLAPTSSAESCAHVVARFADQPTTMKEFVWAAGQKLTTGLGLPRPCVVPCSRPAVAVFVPLNPVSDHGDESRACSDESTLTTFEGAVITWK